MKKILIICSLLLLTVVTVFAQTDSTGGGDGGFSISPTLAWVLGAILMVYELAVRLFPTVKNYSIIGFIITIIQKILPNKPTEEAKIKAEKAMADPKKDGPPVLP